MNTIKEEIKYYTPAIFLDRYFPRKARNLIELLLVLLSAILFAVLALYSFTDGIPGALFSSAQTFFGLFLISFGLMLAVASLSFFRNSLYFRGIEMIVHKGSEKGSIVSYEVAQALRSSPKDIAKSFLRSKYGREIMARCNIGTIETNAYLAMNREKLDVETMPLSSNTVLTIKDISSHLYQNDQVFKNFLFSHGVEENIYFGATDWITRSLHASKHSLRWWSRESLGKVRGIGSDWSYGGAYILERYTRNINTTGVFSVLGSDTAYAEDKVSQVEGALSRSKAANALIVGEEGVGKMDIVRELGRKIRTGKTLPGIVNKYLMVFDTDRFIASHESKEEFEPNFLKLLLEAENAGNIILVVIFRHQCIALTGPPTPFHFFFHRLTL